MAPLVPNKWPLNQWPGSHATARPAGPLAAGITGPLLVAATAVIPVLLRLGIPTGRGRGSAAHVWVVWGDVVGLVALVLLAWVIVLSTRLRLLERLFGGLDRLYHWHHLLGGTAFGLAVAHPLAYALSGARRWAHDPTALWWSGGNPVIALGQIALYTMTPVVMVTLLVRTRMRHETFVWIHRILGLAFVLAGLHALLVGGAISRSGLLRAYMVVVVAAGLVALVGHTLLGRLVHRHLYRVNRVRRLGNDLIELIVIPAHADRLHFDPGQFVFVSFARRPPGRPPHPFTIASSPDEDQLRFVIKEVGDFTRSLEAVSIGDPVRMEGPYGGFSSHYWPHQRQIWVAGGIGVAPFLSMARSRRDGDPPVDLYYCVRHRDEAVFADELRSIEHRRPGLRVHLVVEDVAGPPTTDLIEQETSLNEAQILLCGPRVMIRGLRRNLRAQGVPGSRIHLEDFEYF
jgi:predicted ferric reductase